MIYPLSNIEAKKVDWWFIYKLPKSIGPHKNSIGFEFLYCDALSEGGLKMSKVNLDHDQSAIGLTLGQIFDANSDSGYVMWNDEIPPTQQNPQPKNQSSKGHSKGVLAFNKKSNCGFYLLHSTPRFPNKGILELPENERSYGQCYLCIALHDYNIANRIAEGLHEKIEAQVYESNLIDVEKDEAIFKLAKDLPFDKNLEPLHLKIKTDSGYGFEWIAKSKYWSMPKKGENEARDFWKDLVGPSLNCDLNVETWRRGLVFSDLDDSKQNKITKDSVAIDLKNIGLEGYNWAFTKDHAKWGISVSKDPGYIIVADINRQISQAHRGGGGLVFKNQALWQSLKDIEIAERKIEKVIHKDSKEQTAS